MPPWLRWGLIFAIVTIVFFGTINFVEQSGISVNPVTGVQTRTAISIALSRLKDYYEPVVFFLPRLLFSRAHGGLSLFGLVVLLILVAIPPFVTGAFIGLLIENFKRRSIT